MEDSRISQIKDRRPKIKDQVSAIILAAGRSRRMGKFKPLLPFGDATVIESCIGNLRAAGIGEIVIVVGHRHEDVRRHLGSEPVRFVINTDPDTAMSESIALGVGALSEAARAVLVTPVDYPAVPPAVTRLLIEEWRAGSRAVQPEFEGKGGHPVLIDLSYRKELMRLDADSGLRGFFSRHRAGVLRLPVDSPFVARDIDTWEDYRALHWDVFGRKPRETVAPEELFD